MSKYSRLRERVVAEEVLAARDLVEPAGVTDEHLLRVHSADYVERVTTGQLERSEVRAMGFPWSPQLVERSRRSVGGTLAAARWALDWWVGVNLAGGTHHAYADRGTGFCVFNDVAVAVRTLQQEDGLVSCLVVDCDVHQGDGTASILGGDPGVFTLSIHGRKNFPFRKQASDLDIALDDDCGDEEYLENLEKALETAFSAATGKGPYDLVFYLAGADPYSEDRLGRLALTKEGLSRRDEMVFSACRERQLPIAVAMAGGYCLDVEKTVGIHLETVRLAVASHRQTGSLARV